MEEKVKSRLSQVSVILKQLLHRAQQKHFPICLTYAAACVFEIHCTATLVFSLESLVTVVWMCLLQRVIELPIDLAAQIKLGGQLYKGKRNHIH